jgi:hypothetical protein
MNAFTTSLSRSAASICSRSWERIKKNKPMLLWLLTIVDLSQDLRLQGWSKNASQRALFLTKMPFNLRKQISCLKNRLLGSRALKLMRTIISDINRTEKDWI